MKGGILLGYFLLHNKTHQNLYLETNTHYLMGLWVSWAQMRSSLLGYLRLTDGGWGFCLLMVLLS